MLLRGICYGCLKVIGTADETTRFSTLLLRFLHPVSNLNKILLRLRKGYDLVYINEQLVFMTIDYAVGRNEYPTQHR